MAVDAETILIYAVNVVILTHIDAVSIVVNVGTPYKVVPPEILIPGIIPGEEGPGTDHGRRERAARTQQISGLYGTGFLQDLLFDEVPAVVQRLIHEGYQS